MIRCDYQLRQAMNVLSDPLNAFNNPLTSRIGSVAQAGLSAKATLASQLASPTRPPGLTDQEWDARLASMDGMTALFTDLFGNGAELTLASKLGQFKSYTDWQSGLGGSTGLFPSNVLSGMGTGVSNAAGLALLGGATFGALMSVASNSKLSAFQNNCQPGQVFDLPNIPLPTACEGTNNIFATILGGYNAALDLMNATFGAISTFVAKTAAELQALSAWINQQITDLVSRVTRELNLIANKLLEAAAAGMAHLLKALALDPCTAAILGQIGTSALRGALNITNPADLLGRATIPGYL